MTQKQMESLISDIFEEVQDMRDAGQKEYAQREDNAFANFERISGWLDRDKKEVLMVYLMKHIDGICSWINGHKSQREDVTGRIVDCIVYLCLLYGMSQEKEPLPPNYQKIGDHMQTTGDNVI